MADSNTPPNQGNFQDNQNFDIDIEKIYTDFIKNRIDNTRSYINVLSPANQTKIKTLAQDNVASLSSLFKMESTPQESRCHAFYRFIGFPVIGQDSSDYYNPGLDIIEDPLKKIKQSDKINIASNPKGGFNSLSSQRENYTNDIVAVFKATPSTITASALALSSSIFVRAFSAPLNTSDDPYSFSANDQAYVASFQSQIGKNDQVQLTDYIDEFGNNPDFSKLKHTRFHFIKPFMVDPRIDFTVSPHSKSIAVPFSKNSSNLIIGENARVGRPLIEKIISDKFSVADQNNLGTSSQSIKDYIQSVQSIQDNDLIKQMNSGDFFKLGLSAQFDRYLNIIRTMCQALVKAQLEIQLMQSRYYWLPIPSAIGPEGGSSVKDIIISKSLTSNTAGNFITPTDQAIILATLQQPSNFNPNTVSSTGTPDQFGFQQFSTFDEHTSSALGNNIGNQLRSLNKRRNLDLSVANKALRTVEIIMGEFSGLGLCDIVAITGALYIMPKEDIVGFLDKDAYVRAAVALNQEVSFPSNPGIDQAQKSFIAKLKDFYNLMDKIYQDISQNNGLS